jgi:hypothetical protein
MASTLILTGGSATQRTLKETITQIGHGFLTGQVVRYDTVLSKYVLAQADTTANAEVVGVISETPDNDTFEVIYSGYIDLPASFAGVSYPVLFLSAETAGGLTFSPPSYVGGVVKPVVTRNTSGQGHIVTNYLGTQIGGSSTVAIEEIQPVGTIIPFAGNAIPNTWLSCDGASYSKITYGELYDKLLFTSGDRAPMYGHVATLTTNTNIFSVNDGVRIGGTDDSPGILGKVITVTGTPNQTIVVQVQPRYNSTTKRFEFPNKVFSTGPANKIGNSNSFSITAVSVTHFNTPDLRGRFPIGVNSTTIAESETDTGFSSTISAGYTLGVFGGQEGVPVDTQMATGSSGKHVNTSGSGTGTVPNLPPFLAIQYIIKARPYAKAAILEGIDFPYDKLLVRDLRTRNYGGQNFPLEVYMNQSGDSGAGTLVLSCTEKQADSSTTPNVVIGATTGNNNGKKLVVCSNTANEQPLRLANGNGTLDIGALNSSFCHFSLSSTSSNNRGFFFNKSITADGVFSAYSNNNLQLCTNNGDNTRIFASHSTGYVAIGNTSPEERLHVTGNILATGDVTAFSDARLKTDVVRIDNPLERVKGIEGVLYTDTEGKRKTGVIAQQVQAVLPEAVHGNESGYLSVAYGNMVGLLVECVKAQQQQIDELVRKIDTKGE